MRLGKFVEHFKAAATAADAKSMDPVLKYLAVGRQLGYAFYLTFDAVTYFDSVGVRKFEGAARLQKEAYRAWLAGLLCNVVAGVYQLYNLQMAARKNTESVDAEKAVEKKKLEKCVTAIVRSRNSTADVQNLQGPSRHSTTIDLRSMRLHRPEQRARLR